MIRPRSTTMVFLLGLSTGAGALPCESRAEGDDNRVSFRQHIRPILAANCFKCHGPDSQAREAELRLDLFKEATADREDSAAIVPGNPSASELYRRINAADESQRMPPPESNKTLSKEQREQLRRWIEQGAEYEAHWAFEPLSQPPLPEVSSPQWASNDIDRFILAELDRNGLRPSPPADRYQLVRRLYLDLIGLPPTPREADEFVFDNRPDAYQRLVDELLASPHYGERWARRWLDLARYSDTNGYEKDRPRSMWLYRDWVIKALNDDMPFDQFTIEQLAGDMLPGATREQRIATGFHRNTMTNEEGGVDPQEFRFNSIVDRVGTTGTVWLGLSVGCAQCHTHKFDPLTHEDFYALFALFNNANEVEDHVETTEIAEGRARVQKKIAELIDAITKDPGPTLQDAFAIWLLEAAAEVSHWRTVPPSDMKSNLADLTLLEDDSVLASGDVTKKDVYGLEFDLGEEAVAAVRIEALTDDSLPAGGPGRQTIEVANASGEGDFFLSEMSASVIEQKNGQDRFVRPVNFAAGRASFATAGMSAGAAFDGRSDTAWRIMGREGEPHAAVFTFQEPVKLAAGERLSFRLVHESFYPAGLGRFRFSFSSDSGELPFALYPQDITDALRKDEADRTADENEVLLEYFLLQSPELKASQEEIAELRKQLPKPITALVLEERAVNPRVTYRHHRGEFLKPAEAIAPSVPEFLPPLPAGAPANRLTFARWLVDPANPLVARVAVNRQWQAFFGQGLVRTTEDFGLQGEFPTHPQLLDYLATEFVRNSWSLKRLHKLIVTSSTYQQAAHVTPERMERDPENKLLARAPRFRLDAELVRDVALQASGLLCARVGGPSVFPDQPAGITEAAYGPLAWKVSDGDDRFRRGIYTFNKRTAPYAAFGLFDAPSGEACIARRSSSNTPLQSLAMLNDTTMVVAARELARTAIQTAPPQQSRIATEIFRRCVTRPPTDRELEALCDFQARQREQIATGMFDPAPIIQSGDEGKSPPQGLDAGEYAAWVLTARAVLNLDETITRQ